MYLNVKNPLLSTKVKNAFKKVGDYDFTIKNIDINGSKRGCSGFIENKTTGAVVYINTESSVNSSVPPLMFRYARDTKDYKGLRNRFCYTLEEMVKEVSEMLKTPVKDTPEYRAFA